MGKFRGMRQGTTTELGYGNAHMKARATAFAQLPEWSPCCRCGLPMWKHAKEPDGMGRMRSALHYDHAPDGSYLGFSCAPCNRSAGARTANMQASHNRRAVKSMRQSRVW